LFSPKPKTPIDYKKRLLNSPNQGKIQAKIKRKWGKSCGEIHLNCHCIVVFALPVILIIKRIS